jgi:hypothetical protein
MDTVLHATQYVCNIVRENLNIPGQESLIKRSTTRYTKFCGSPDSLIPGSLSDSFLSGRLFGDTFSGMRNRQLFSSVATPV